MEESDEENPQEEPLTHESQHSTITNDTSSAESRAEPTTIRFNNAFPLITLWLQCATRMTISTLIDRKVEYDGLPIVSAFLFSVFDCCACRNRDKCIQTPLSRIMIYTALNIPINACIQSNTAPNKQLPWLYLIEIGIAITMSCLLCHAPTTDDEDDLRISDIQPNASSISAGLTWCRESYSRESYIRTYQEQKASRILYEKACNPNPHHTGTHQHH